MIKRQEILYLLTIIMLIVLPATGSLSYFFITNDPSIRPLGITQESLRAYSGAAEPIEIVASVDWDSTRSSPEHQIKMQTTLINVFRSKGLKVRVVFRDARGGTFVTYRVGSSVIGPFPKSQLAGGINAAIAAYRMHVPFAPETQ